MSADDAELVERRRSVERLAVLLDELDRQDGPLPEDPEEDARIDALLGGARPHPDLRDPGVTPRG